MTILRTDTISGIGATPTEGTTFDGHMKFNNPNYFTLPKGTTRERYQTKVGDIVSDNLISTLFDWPNFAFFKPIAGFLSDIVLI